MNPGVLPDTWLSPAWDAPPVVGALCSGRLGGVSDGPWHSLNLGDHVGDDPAAVAENRRRFASALGARPVFLQQVHGTEVVQLQAGTADGRQADACITTQRGVACTIMVADCLPVLLCDVRGRAVAAAHAGWRGLAGRSGTGVLETLWQAWWPQVAASTEEAARNTRVWLGPCIGPSAFEVGPEVRAAFQQADAQAAARFVPGIAGKWLADLPGLARDRLAALGLYQVSGNDGTAVWCTVTQASRFFSHRRDRVSGRLAAAVWLV